MMDDEAVAIRAENAINIAIAEWHEQQRFVPSQRDLFRFAFQKGAAFGAEECKRAADEFEADARSIDHNRE